MSQSREANMEKICSLFLLIPGSLACSSFWLNLVRPHELRLNHKMLAEPLPNLGEVTWSLVDFSIKVL